MNQELLSFGERLRASREALDLTLHEAEVETRIRAKFLQSFEEGQPDPSLTYTQVRGFLRNYARLLRLDPDDVLAQYEHAHLSRPKRWGLFRRQPPDLAENTSPTRAKSQRTPAAPLVPPVIQGPVESERSAMRQALRLVTLVAAGLIFLFLIGVGLLILLPALEDDPANQSLLNPPLAATDSGEPDLPSATPTPTPEAATALPTQGGIVLDSPPLEGLVMFINVIARSWVEIAVDGETQQRGVLQAGTGLQYQAQDSISLTTANAGGLEVTINNQALGSLGAQGEYFQQTFTRAGLATQTLPPTLPPTLTPSPTITDLPLPSTTPTYTSTASATITGSAATQPVDGSSGIIATEPLIILPAPGQETPTSFPAATIVPTETIITATLFIPSSTPTPTSSSSPSSTPTMTPTNAPTSTSPVILPERITRTPHP